MTVTHEDMVRELRDLIDKTEERALLNESIFQGQTARRAEVLREILKRVCGGER